MGCRGTVGTEKHWVQRNSKYRGTEDQKNCGYRETVDTRGTEEQ